VGVHRLEADAEPPDRGEVTGLGALADPADAAHVGLGERPPVVPQLEPVREQLEGQLGRAGVLGVLDQLEDEVRALAVQLAEQVEHGGVPAVPGDVLLADLLVIGWHPGTITQVAGQCDTSVPARGQSSASVVAAASTLTARPSSPVMCEPSSAGVTRLAASRQKPTASATIARLSRPAVSSPMATSQVPPPVPVSTRRTSAGGRPIRAAAYGSIRAARSLIRLSTGGSGTDGGRPTARRMSLSCTHSSNARTTSRSSSGSRMPCTAILPAQLSAARSPPGARTSSSVWSAARRHSSRVSAGERP